MTDSCATCRFFDGVNECRSDPPEVGATQGIARRVTPSYWCGSFSAGSSGARLPYTGLVVAANATNTFLFVSKADGTLWLSINNGATWAQVTGP